VEGNFAALGTREELLGMNGLDGPGIAAGVSAFLTENQKKREAPRSWIAEPK
jgi:hypothetical protein